MGSEEPPIAPLTQESKWMEFFKQDYLFGDWGGYRTALSERGIDFEFYYVASMPWNTHGGIDTGPAYQGALLATLDLTSEKLIGFPGGHLHWGNLWLHGEDHYSDNHIGDLNKVSTIDFPGGLRMLDLWYEQRFLRDMVSLKLGQLVVDNDFVVPEFYNSLGYLQFVNQTWFYPTLAFNVWDMPMYPVGDHALTSTPFGALGARLRIDPVDRFYLQAAVYDGMPNVSSSYVDIRLDSDEGALAYFEVGYKINQKKGDSGLPGNVKFGGYLHTDDFYDNEDVILSFVGLSSGTKTHSPNYGLYFLADQTLYLEQGKEGPARQGLAGFFRLCDAPSDRNLTQFEIAGGLVYRGLLPGRDYDSLGVAASYLEMSEDIAEAQRTVNQLVPGLFEPVDYEGLLEVTYRAQMTAWWAVIPSFQWVMHPGGSGEIPDAYAFVLLSTLRF